MNVLIFALYYPPDLGGSSIRAYNAAQGLQTCGAKITVITAFPHYPSGVIPPKYKNRLFTIEYENGIKVIRTFILPLPSKGILNRMLLFLVYNIFAIFSLLFINNIDIIWVANPGIISMFPAYMYHTINKVPIVLNVDDISISNVIDLKFMSNKSIILRIANSITNFYYSRVEFFTPISPGYIPFITQYGVNSDQIIVIYGGVDLSTFKPINVERNDNKFYITYSGSFSIAYDFDQIFEAAEMLQLIDNDIMFILQGRGEMESKIVKKITEIQSGNVHMLNLFLTRDDVSLLLNRSDALILPHKDFGRPYTGISSKLFEYQAVAKPILCCSTGQSADYVLNTNSGLVSKPGDAPQLVKNIYKLKNDSSFSHLLGLNGYNYVNNEVNINIIGKKMMKLFINILQEHKNIL